MIRAVEGLVRLVYPERCRHCGGVVEPGRRFFCAVCMDEAVPVGERSCTICGRPYRDGSGGGHPCWRCMETRPPYEYAKAPCVFGGAVREAVHLLKFGKVRAMSGVLSGLSAGRLAGWFGDVTLCAAVPLHKNRLRGRGFNQSLLLARDAAMELDVRLSIDGLVRARDTKPQVDIPAKERAANVKGAFYAARPGEFAGESVLLVDDVYTTGATVKECAVVLKKAGAKAVYVLTAARAV